MLYEVITIGLLRMDRAQRQPAGAAKLERAGRQAVEGEHLGGRGRAQRPGIGVAVKVRTSTIFLIFLKRSL